VVLVAVWIGCLTILKSPSETLTGHLAFWGVYVLVPPLAAYTTRVTARFLSQRQPKNASSSVKDLYMTDVSDAPGAMFRDRIGMQQSGLPLIGASLFICIICGLFVGTLLQGSLDRASAIQLLLVFPVSLLMLLTAGITLIRLPEQL
jgi:hypothetical protein